jgi:quercetin dioxygenase-like cupin family protein
MTQLQEIPATRPFAVEAGEGEQVDFGGALMTFKATAATTGGELFAMETGLRAGYSPPLHVHHDDAEAVYVLEGTLEIACGEERWRAEAGAFAWLPAGVAHSFVVVSPEARVLTVGVPAGLEDFFREAGAPVLDLAKLQRVAAEHNIEFVGPPLTIDA